MLSSWVWLWCYHFRDLRIKEQEKFYCTLNTTKSWWKLITKIFSGNYISLQIALICWWFDLSTLNAVKCRSKTILQLLLFLLATKCWAVEMKTRWQWLKEGAIQIKLLNHLKNSVQEKSILAGFLFYFILMQWNKWQGYLNDIYK